MRWVVVGGSGFVGSEVCRRLTAAGERFEVVDLGDAPQPGEGLLRADLLIDEVVLPPGRVVLSVGRSMPRPVRPWTLALDNVVATARLAPQLNGRDVVLMSSVEVYGWAPGPLRENTEPQLPLGAEALAVWVERVVDIATSGPCPPHRVVALCRELADLDASGRWVYALAKLAQEQVLLRCVGPDRLTILRLANVVGHRQHRVLGRIVEAALAGRPCVVTDNVRSFVSVEQVAQLAWAVRRPGCFNVSSGTLALRELAGIVAAELDLPLSVEVVPASAPDNCGDVDASRLRREVGEPEDVRGMIARCARAAAAGRDSIFATPLEVVVPPRPERPDRVCDRIGAALWSGRLREGRWSAALTALLERQLGPIGGLGERRVQLTNSGTNALRLALSAVAGRPEPGAVALCPAFTFHASAEVLRQLGWAVRLIDVDPRSWTLDPDALEAALREPRVGVVLAVDALGNPCDYQRLVPLCRAAGVPLVADSAAALGARFQGTPVGTQADAHAFSMSFAKVVSGGGSGGAVVLPMGADLHTAEHWQRSAHITELSAVVALDGVDELEQLVARRERVAVIYAGAAQRHPALAIQQVRSGDRHAWVHWVLRVPPHLGRDRLATALLAQGVHTKPYYEPLSQGPAPTALPTTAALHAQALALPMSSELCADDADRVVVALSRALRDLDHGNPVPMQAVLSDESLSLT